MYFVVVVGRASYDESKRAIRGRHSRIGRFAATVMMVVRMVIQSLPTVEAMSRTVLGFDPDVRMLKEHLAMA
jgi:hypothetical protein